MEPRLQPPGGQRDLRAPAQSRARARARLGQGADVVATMESSAVPKPLRLRVELRVDEVATSAEVARLPCGTRRDAAASPPSACRNRVGRLAPCARGRRVRCLRAALQPVRKDLLARRPEPESRGAFVRRWTQRALHFAR